MEAGVSRRRRRRAVNLFSPLALFDPSALSGSHVDSQAVGAVSDGTGNGWDLEQPIGLSQPLYRTDGTRNWLEFDGINDFMTGSHRFGFSANPGFSMLAAIRPTVLGANPARLFHLGASTGSGQIAACIQSAGISWRHNNGNRMHCATWSTGTDYIVEFWREEGDTYGDQRAGLDGVELPECGIGNPTGVPTDATELTGVGAAPNGSSPVGMDLFGLTVLSVADEAERAKARAWCADRLAS